MSQTVNFCETKLLQTCCQNHRSSNNNSPKLSLALLFLLHKLIVFMCLSDNSQISESLKTIAYALHPFCIGENTFYHLFWSYKREKFPSKSISYNFRWPVTRDRVMAPTPIFVAIAKH